MIAYLHAFWAGQVEGPAFWLTIGGLGLLIAAVIVVALTALADWSTRRWPGDLGSDAPEHAPTPRDPNARFTTVITALAWTGVLTLVATR